MVQVYLMGLMADEPPWSRIPRARRSLPYFASGWNQPWIQNI